MLTRLANRGSKIYAAFSGVPGSDDENLANECFNDICRLVQLKLLVDISDEPRWQGICDDHAARGQQVIIGVITNRGGWMFERTKWEKWVN